MKRLTDLKDNLPNGSPEITKVVKHFVQTIENTDTLVKESKEKLIELEKQSAAIENWFNENAMLFDLIEKMHDEF